MSVANILDVYNTFTIGGGQGLPGPTGPTGATGPTGPVNVNPLFVDAIQFSTQDIQVPNTFLKTCTIQVQTPGQNPNNIEVFSVNTNNAYQQPAALTVSAMYLCNNVDQNAAIIQADQFGNFVATTPLQQTRNTFSVTMNPGQTANSIACTGLQNTGIVQCTPQSLPVNSDGAAVAWSAFAKTGEIAIEQGSFGGGTNSSVTYNCTVSKWY